MTKVNSRVVDLENGNITGALMALALPIMGSMLIQMAYTLVDTAWVGLLGSNAVAAVATAGQIIWIGQGVAMIPQFGGQILTGKELGAANLHGARKIASVAIRQAVIFMVLYSSIICVFRGNFIGFFHLNNRSTIAMAHVYTLIVGIGMPIYGLNTVINGQFTSMGDSRTPLYFNSTGVVINMLLDPILMFGAIGFPRLGVYGAAIATVLSQLIVLILYIIAMIRDNHLFVELELLGRIDVREFMRIFKLGIPPALQTVFFALVSIVISRIVVRYGDSVLAIQRVGGMIESVTWMVADGFSLAMTSFTARNFGAKKGNRIKAGYRSAIRMMTLYGAIISAAFLLFAVPIFRIFLHEENVVQLGGVYLRIQAISQIFICLSAISCGAFNGLGETKLPAYISIGAKVLRIPLALVFIHVANSITGAWWALTLTSVLEGALIAFLFYRHLQKGINYDRIWR